MILSPTDISIDILIMLLWWLSMYRSIMSIIYNDIPFRWKVYMALYTAIGFLYSFQTIVQVLTGKSASVVLWDVVNAITVFIALTKSTVLYNRKNAFTLNNRNDL